MLVNAFHSGSLTMSNAKFPMLRARTLPDTSRHFAVVGADRCKRPFSDRLFGTFQRIGPGLRYAERLPRRYVRLIGDTKRNSRRVPRNDIITVFLCGQASITLPTSMPFLIFIMSRAKRWCFTLNHPQDDEEQALVDAAERDDIEYLVFGRERGSSGTPHLQGYVIFTAAIRIRTVKSRLGSLRYHLEVSRGTPKEASDYCKKDGDYEEFGECPEVSQGKRSDLDGFFAWADEFCTENGCPPRFQDAAREHPKVIAKYPRILEIVNARWTPPPIVNGSPRDWQVGLNETLRGDADDRTIDFVVDPEGAKGKSWFCRWFLSQHEDCQFLSVGKRDDLTHVIDIQTKYFLFDIPRGQMEFLQYSVLEMMKNQLVFSPKYHSQVKRLIHTPHIVVFCNEEPDMSKLTEDRYRITYI